MRRRSLFASALVLVDLRVQAAVSATKAARIERLIV